MDGQSQALLPRGAVASNDDTKGRLAGEEEAAAIKAGALPESDGAQPGCWSVCVDRIRAAVSVSITPCLQGGLKKSKLFLFHVATGPKTDPSKCALSFLVSVRG